MESLVTIVFLTESPCEMSTKLGDLQIVKKFSTLRHNFLSHLAICLQARKLEQCLNAFKYLIVSETLKNLHFFSGKVLKRAQLWRTYRRGFHLKIAEFRRRLQQIYQFNVRWILRSRPRNRETSANQAQDSKADHRKYLHFSTALSTSYCDWLMKVAFMINIWLFAGKRISLW